MERVGERVIVEPQPAPLHVNGPRIRAKALEAGRVLREHMDRSGRPECEKSLDGYLKHGGVAVVQEVMGVRFYEDPRPIGHSGQS